ncbi:MAG: hypothetical protein SOZ59_09710 [Candidatus Limivivens sp.]|nr:hypothetical protein [Candidatus Limivivens sp.]
MSKKFAFLLTAALTVTAAFTAAAEEDMTGEWYGNLYGMPATLTLDESGEYTLAMEMGTEEEDEDPGVGKWEFDGESLVMDKGEDTEVVFAYDGEFLSTEIEGMELTFSRDPEAATGFVPAEVRTDAELEDFAGKWTGTKASYFGMTAPLETMEMEKVEIEIEENRIAFTMVGGFLFGEWEIPDLEGELKDGALTFVVPAEDEYSEDTEWSICLHEDGTLSLRVNMLGEELIIYMEPAAEETEETEEATEE